LRYSENAKPIYYAIGADFCFYVSYYFFLGLSLEYARHVSDLIEDSFNLWFPSFVGNISDFDFRLEKNAD